MDYYLAIDIGGTFIKYGKVNAEGQLFSQNQVATPSNEHGAIVKKIEEIVTISIRNGTRPAGIGISTAGVVDTASGEVIYAGPTMPHYDGTNFKRKLEAAFSMPVIVNNDVNAALLGEQWQGAAQGQTDVYCITLGTGIGGAYYHNELVTGTGSKAGEVGYLLYNKQTGETYEQRASTGALQTRAAQSLGYPVNVKELFECAKAHNQAAHDIIDAWACDIAEGLAQIIIIVDPQLLLIGGGVSKQGDFLLAKIAAYIDDFLPEGFRQTELKCTALGNDAALYGAVSYYFK